MAKWPYNTTRWLRLREAHLSISPLCEGCEAEGRMVEANTVDHRTPISAGGDPFPGHDGLASYCVPCHSRKTARGLEAGAARAAKNRRGCNPDGSPIDNTHPWNGGNGFLTRAAMERRMPSDLKPSRIPLTIVCGPPGAGKSTYVREHATRNDLIICLDRIMQDMSGLPEHQTPGHLVGPALTRRNDLLRSLARDIPHAAAWFIISAPKPQERRVWASRLHARLVVLDTQLPECIRRIRADASRAGHEERMIDAATRWWAANPTLVRKKSLRAEASGPRVYPNIELVSKGLGQEIEL